MKKVKAKQIKIIAGLYPVVPTFKVVRRYSEEAKEEGAYSLMYKLDGKNWENDVAENFKKYGIVNTILLKNGFTDNFISDVLDEHYLKVISQHNFLMMVSDWEKLKTQILEGLAIQEQQFIVNYNYNQKILGIDNFNLLATPILARRNSIVSSKPNIVEYDVTNPLADDL